MIFNMYVNSIGWLILQEESSTRSAIPPGLCQLLFCTVSRTCFRLLLQFLLRQAKRWLPFLCVTDYSDVPSSCDPFIQDLKLWGFRDLLYIAILTGTPRGTTPTPRRKGTRSCCLPSMIFRFVTSLVTPGVYIFPFSLPTLEPRRKLVDCGQEGLVERLPLVLLHQQVHCLL